MILQIAICDDEKDFCAELESVLKEILDGFEIEYKIDIFYSGEEFCEKIHKNVYKDSAMYYNLVFLDIEFAKNEINGVEVGKQIRRVYQRHPVSIIFISWEMKYSMQLFDIRPLNFLIKPLEYEKLRQVVKTYLSLSGIWFEDFVYKVRHDIFRVKVKDIVYLESTNRKLILNLADGRKELFYGVLKEIYQEQLHKFDFLHIHASYAVNYIYISLLARYHVVLYNNTTLPISRQKKKETDKAYFAIMERRGMV